MIFSPDLAAKISLGEKTVTRRPVKRDSEGSALPCTYEPGKSYAVQLHRGGFSVDRILIRDVSRETIELPLSWTESRAEGFDSPRGFSEKWQALYGDNAPSDVWRIEFELVRASLRSLESALPEGSVTPEERRTRAVGVSALSQRAAEMRGRCGR